MHQSSGNVVQISDLCGIYRLLVPRKLIIGLILRLSVCFILVVGVLCALGVIKIARRTTGAKGCYFPAGFIQVANMFLNLFSKVYKSLRSV